MDSQLELELYKPDKRTKAPNPLLPAFENKKKEEISNRLDKLENYLNDDGVIKEYDGGDYAKVKKKLGLNSPSSQIPLQELTKLADFIRTDLFKVKFSIPIHELAEGVKNEIERAHSNGTK